MDYDSIKEKYIEFYQSSDYENIFQEVDDFENYNSNLKEFSINLEGIIRNEQDEVIDAIPIGKPELYLDFEDDNYFNEFLKMNSPKKADGYVIRKEKLQYPNQTLNNFQCVSIIGIQFYKLK
ncbi:MAG: hypothetical protein ACOCP8_05805 [archaeon]